MQRACVILNPEAGRGRGRRLCRHIEAALRAAGSTFTIRESRYAGDERALATQAARERWPVVLAAGGDGTVHGVVNGLLTVDDTPALGVIPIGTGNDFAKLTGLPRAPVRAVIDALRRARPRRFDVGQIGHEYFANGMGIGFGPAVVRQMARFPRLRGFLLYLAAVGRTFARFRPIAVTIEAEEYRGAHEIMLTEIAIGTTAGGGFRLTPDADPSDGRLDVCVIRGVGFAEFLRYIPRVMRGTHGRLPPVTLFRTRRVRCRGTTPLEAHLDGELRTFETTEIEIAVVPQRLNVLCAV